MLRNDDVGLTAVQVYTVNANTVFGTAAQTYEGFAMSHDGTKIMFNIYNGVERFSRMALATPYDLSSTITVAHYTKWNAQPWGIGFNNDGTKAYNFQLGHTLFEKSTGAAYGIGTLSPVTTGSLAVSEAAFYHTTMRFNNDGTILYVAAADVPGALNDRIMVLPMSTPYDSSTLGAISNIDFDSLIGFSRLTGFVFVDSGNKLILGTDADELMLLNLSTPYDISTHSAIISTLDLTGEITGTIRGLTNGDNDTRLYLYTTTGDVYEYIITY